MKIKILLPFFCICGFSMTAQKVSEMDSLKNIKDSLIGKKNKIEIEINDIDNQINLLKVQQMKLVESGQAKLCNTKVTYDISVRDAPSFLGNVIGNLQAGEEMEVYGYQNKYWLVKLDSIEGYVHGEGVFFEETPEMAKYKERWIKAGKTQNIEDRKKKLVDKYGESIANRILFHQYWIGMTPDMARLSLGNPKDINRSVGSWGTHEQWVYDNMYLYFENGKLTSWQD